MKIKKYTSPILLSVLLIVSSCSGMLKPAHTDERDIKIDIYDNVIRHNTSDVEIFLSLVLGENNDIAISDNEKEYRTEMLGWVLNNQIEADDYIGYFVTYQVTTDFGTFYVLVDLIEYYDSDRYEWTVIDIDEFLPNVQSYIY